MRFEKYLPHYTVADYSTWEGDWELIEGIPYAMNSPSSDPNAMSPSPMHDHQRLSGELYLQMGISLKAQKDTCGDCRAIYDLDWIIDDDTVIRPDVAIICGPVKDFITTAPLLVVEISSRSTVLKDRNIKFQIYQEQGVRYYILADPIAKSHNIFELVNNQYQEQPDLRTFVIHEQCKVTINVAEALASL